MVLISLFELRLFNPHAGKVGRGHFQYFITKYDGSSYYVETMAAKFGLAVAPGVIALVKRSPGEYAEVAGHYGMVELAPIMARAFHKLEVIS